jgi:GntR family transcriptional regulator
MLDFNSPIPLYYQLKSFIQNQISSGTWKPGEQIPSEAELCDQFQVSRTTIRQAINELVTQGKLKRTQGRGTFVTQYNIEKPLFFLTGFSQDMKQRGLKPVSRVLKLEAIPPSAYIAEVLHLKENEPVIMVKRLRLADDQLMAIDVCYLPFNRYFALLHEDLEENSMYDILARKFETVPVRSVRSIEAISCPPPEGELLQVKPGFPVLYIVGTNFDQNDLPFEHAESFYRGDRFTFNVEILNQSNRQKLPDLKNS